MAPGVVFDGNGSSNADSPATSDTPAPPPLPPPVNNGLPTWKERQQLLQETIPPMPPPVDQFTNLPAALLSNLKREKKPFTYTPGGIDLSEIKSPRMQKRLEANKKLQGVISPLARPPEACGSEEAQKDLLVLPVYNSPLNLYSAQNTKEVLQKQAGMLTKELESLTLSSNGEGNRYNTWSGSKGNNSEYSSKYGQSRSFRMLQLMTDTTDYNDEAPSEPLAKHEDDEMRFTGITREAIPSKFFHTLQKITGTDGASPEPPPVIQYDDVPCPLQSATYGKDFVPPPKTTPSFKESASNNNPSGNTPTFRNDNVSQRSSYPQYRSNEEPLMYQTNQSSMTSNQQFNPITHARSFSDVYHSKATQPFIRPNFQAIRPGTNSTWQPSNNPYSYCTLPRGYHGIPGLEGTDL